MIQHRLFGLALVTFCWIYSLVRKQIGFCKILAIFLLCASIHKCLSAEDLEPIDVWSPAQGFLAEFKSDLCGGPFIINATLKGSDAPLRLAVDTGCKQTILDTRFRHLFDGALTPTVISSDIAPIGAEEFPSASLQANGITFKTSGKMRCIDLSPMNKLIGSNIDGILGIDCLSPYVVHLDWKHRRVLICDSHKVSKPPGKELPLTLTNGAPYIAVDIPGKGKIDCVLDTCAFNNLTVSHAVFEELMADDILRMRPSQAKEVDVAGNIAKSHSGICRAILVAGTQHDNLRVSSGPTNRIGAFILMRYRVTCDFSKKLCYMASYNSDYTYDFGDFDGVGVFNRPGGQKKVTVIDESRAAFGAGLRRNDIIVKLNGRRCEKWSLVEMQMMWNEARLSGSDLIISVERDDRETAIVIRGGAATYAFDSIPKPEGKRQVKLK